jgi:histidine kinase
MDLAAPFAVSSPPAGPGFVGALRGALRRLSWRVVGGTVAIMVALDIWLLFDIAFAGRRQMPSGEAVVSGAIINLAMAFYIMAAALVADEFVARGARRLPAYTSAVVIGSAAGALVQWAIHRWLHLAARFPSVDELQQLQLIHVPIVFFEYLIWGSIIVFIYVNGRTALLAAARLNEAQVQRADSQRRTLESRLQALQARVEPQFLFDTLLRVRELYESNPARGSQMLDELIVYLRAALPHLRDSASILQQELKLVRAYMNIMRVRLSTPLVFDIVASQAELCARVPSMIILPLINQLVGTSAPSAGSRTIRFEAHAEVDRLRLQLSSNERCLVTEIPSDMVTAIRDRLHALFGDRGKLDFRSSPLSPATTLVIEIPYEPTDRSDR